MKIGELGNYEGMRSARKGVGTLSNMDPVDVHCYTVFMISGTSYHLISDDMRDKMKPVGFGILYGRTAVGLAPQLKVSIRKAQEYIDGWLNTYSGVKAFLKECRSFIAEHSYITTYYGRRRLVHPNLRGVTDAERVITFERAGAFRELTNMVVQGASADQMKMAMIKMRKRIEEEKLPAVMILQIHDEIVVLCRREVAPAVAKVVEEEMVADIKGILVTGKAKIVESLSKNAENLRRQEWESTAYS